jgi:catechol-2,3-dioxygenase
MRHSAPVIEAFDHVHVYVCDRDAAETWYAQIFGFSRSKELEFWAVDGGPLTIQNESGSVHFALFARPAPARHSTIALRVNRADFAAWRAHLAHCLPGEFSEEDHEVSRSLYFSDPDKNPFEITTYKVD